MPAGDTENEMIYPDEGKINLTQITMFIIIMRMIFNDIIVLANQVVRYLFIASIRLYYMAFLKFTEKFWCEKG